MCALEMAAYDLFNNVKYKGVINKNEILLKQFLNIIKDDLPGPIAELVPEMLNFNYKKRPTLKEIFLSLENAEL